MNWELGFFLIAVISGSIEHEVRTAGVYTHPFGEDGFYMWYKESYPILFTLASWAGILTFMYVIFAAFFVDKWYSPFVIFAFGLLVSKIAHSIVALIFKDIRKILLLFGWLEVLALFGAYLFLFI